MTPKEMAPVASANAAKGPKNEATCEKIIPSPPQEIKAPIEPPGAPQALPWASSFRIAEDGIYLSKFDDKKEQEVVTWIFSPLKIEARTCDLDDQNWGLLLKIKTPSGIWHQWAMPAAFMSGNIYREILFRLGLQIAPWADKHLHQYLLSARPAKLVRCVQKIGWHGNVYVLPDTYYGPPGAEPVILQSDMPITVYREQGSLEDWQQHIGRLCLGNSRLIFAVSTAFAAIMLKTVKMSGAGFHFVGISSIGKSTILYVAASICGGGGDNGFIRRWRTSDNALESWALMHNNNLLLLDEISQVSSKAAAEIAYMLANGQGKGRAGKDGIARPVHEWRLLFLSNGEISLEQKLKEDGHRYMAGQAVRVIHIPADAQTGYGIFENLHEFFDGKALSEHLQQSATQYYGVPLRAFLKSICLNLREARDRILALMQRFETTICPGNASEQVRRTAKHFALLAASGELAIQHSVLPWPPGTAVAAARRCLLDWIAFRGGLEAAEVREAINRVRDFLARHGPSRFCPVEEAISWAKPNTAGFRKKEAGENDALFLVYPSVFKEEICAGGDSKAILRYLDEAGFLIRRDASHPSYNHKIPGIKKTLSLYTIKASILAEEDEYLPELHAEG